MTENHIGNERFSTGTRLGQYRIIKKIGSGGTGEVYLCQHIVLEKSYAVKILEITSDNIGKEIRGRMLREARIARSIRHRNLVSVIDANVIKESSAAYIVMEYIDGETLDELISDTPLPESAALYVCRCVAQVLAEAEKHGIVHRDIKPANIMIDRSGDVKLTDLGIAKIDKSNVRYDEPVTHGEKLLGTPDYASPEQLRDPSSVDTRADIYSLGATLYHMLSGHKPFEAVGVFNLMAQVLEDDPQDILDISPATAALVKRMMAKDPNARPQNARELLAELRRTVRSNARQTSEIKRFLANGARQLFSASNIRFFTIARNTFIILCAILASVMIMLHIFYRYDLGKKPEGKEERIIKNLQDKDISNVSAMFSSGTITPQNIIKAVVKSNDTEIFKLAAENFPELTENKEYAPLWMDLLSDEKHRKMLIELLKTNFDINAAKFQKNDPAVFRRKLFRDPELLQLLVRNKLDVNAKDSFNRTALMIMARNRKNKFECARILLKAGADINARDKNGRNAFTAAVNSHNPEFARFLLNHGIKLFDKDISLIPDVMILKHELLAKKQKTKKVQQTVKSENKPEEIKTAVKLPAKEVKTAAEPPPRKASETFLAAVKKDADKVKALAEKRKMQRSKFDETESQKTRRKIEVYLQTDPVRRPPLDGEKEFIKTFMQQLSSGRISPDIRTGRKNTHLLESAANGNIYPRRKLFKALLDAGADPDAVSMPHNDIQLCRMLLEYGRTKLEINDMIKLLSVPEPDWTCAAMMLLRGADPAAANKERKENAFHRAASLGNTEFLSLLLSSGKSGADAKDADGYTPYQRAVMCGKNECAKLLKEADFVSPVTQSMRNLGALFNAVKENDPGAIAYSLLLDTNPLQTNGMYMNVLQYAVDNNSIEAVQILLENGVSPNRYTGVPPLLTALKNGNDEMFALLISNGADPQTAVTDRFGRRSLLFTAVFQYMNSDSEKLHNCLQAMLDNNWNWQIKTPDGDTPVTWMEKWNEGYPETKFLFTGKL